MPILERDPWRYQYFEGVPCPIGVAIPTDDADSWQLYPAHRWIYDKLKIAESQGLDCGPHGVPPQHYPVFSKPLVNLKGMGVGSRVIASPAEMEAAHQPGHMWMTLLTGAHVSTDCAVEDGQVAWMRHATGESWTGGMFKHWTIHAAAMPEVEAYLRRWVASHMAGYTGMMNFETIGGRIIETHLRFADQWCDLYGEGWTRALVDLHVSGRWRFAEPPRRDGFSLPLFASHGGSFRHPPAPLQQRLRALPGIASLQITFHEAKEADGHPMPPGGFRLGIVNATDIAAGLAARRELAAAFPGAAVMLPE